MTPLQLLVLGYFVVVVGGGLILSLPVSSATGTWQPIVDSMFMAMSAISTSGLGVVDLGSYYSRFGQVVMLALFQIGGIGYMAVIMLMAYTLGMRMSLKANIVAKESLATTSFHLLGKFFLDVIILTLLFEAIGAVILARFWMREFPPGEAIYLGVFHSVSAFCTAGFSTFPSSLMNYRESVVMNLTIDILSLVGGLGFFVLIDLYNYCCRKLSKTRPNRLSLQTRIVLAATGLIITLGGVLIFLLAEWPAETGLADRLLIASFQSISASTTDGFNTVDIGVLPAAPLTILMILMFIGASPGSTGGGIKTTTAGAVAIGTVAFLRGSKGANVFFRELPVETVLKSFILLFLFLAIVAVDLTVLAVTETSPFLPTLFEIVSALGNTGLSMGITAHLSAVGKLLLIVTMFIGRVGPLALGAALLGRKNVPAYRYPRENIFIG